MIKKITLTAKPHKIKMGCENDVIEWSTVTKPSEMIVETDNGLFIVSLTLLEQNLDRIKSSNCLYKGV